VEFLRIGHQHSDCLHQQRITAGTLRDAEKIPSLSSASTEPSRELRRRVAMRWPLADAGIRSETSGFAQACHDERIMMESHSAKRTIVRVKPYYILQVRLDRRHAQSARRP